MLMIQMEIGVDNIGKVRKNDHRMIVVLEKVGGKKKCSILYYTTFLISKGA